MTLPSQGDIDIIATHILLDAKQALANLKTLNAQVTDASARLEVLQKIVKATADKMGGDFKRAEMAVQRFSGSITGIKTGEIKMAANLARETNAALEGTGDAAQNGMARALTAVNALRIALGALVAMVFFQLTQAFLNFFTGAKEQALQLEDTMYRLANAEKALSMEGVEVTLKGLKKGIVDIQKLLPIFSKEDVSQLVGTLAVSTKQLKLNEKQILDLAQAVAILNVRSEKQEDLSTTAQHVLSSLLTGNAKGITSLGLAFTDNVMRAKAMELGFLKAGEALAKLSENEKGLTKLALIMESTSQELGSIGDYLDSNTAKILANKAAWNDLLATVGQVIVPFIPSLTEFFKILNGGFQMGKILMVEFAAILNAVAAAMNAMMEGNLDPFKNFGETLKHFQTEFIQEFFPEMPADAPQWFVDTYGDMIKEGAETATAALEQHAQEAEENAEKAAKAVNKYQEDITEAMEDAQQKRIDLERDYGRKLEDIARDYSNKLADIARDTEQKREDALRNLNQKLADIDRDFNNAVQEANEDYREKEIDREEEFQNRLRELREKFLFDLEDALRERDARQVLRLIRQYNMDKTNLEERRKLEEEKSKDDLAQKIADLERERQLKIEAAQREYAERLEEIKIGEQRAREEAALWHKRQLEDARLWHQRQLEEQRQYLQRKLQDLAQALAKELELTNATAQQIAAIISSLTGTSISVPITSSPGSPSTGLTGGFNPYPSFPGFSGGFYAEGGTVIAKRPTGVVFGERGPEAATFTPLNRTGRDVGKVFGDASGVGGAGGALALRIGLGDGITAEIVETTLEHVSAHFEQIRRVR